MDLDYYLSDLFQGITFNPLNASIVISLAIAVLLLVVSGFISGSEVAFFSMSPSDQTEVREKKRACDVQIVSLLERSEYLLATILIINNFVNVAIVMLCSYGINAWVKFQSPLLSFILQTIILTFILLLFGEIMPKIYAQRRCLSFVRRGVPMLAFFEKICRPLARVLVSSSSFINKTVTHRKIDISPDELKKALDLTKREIPEEKQMLEEIIKFYNKTANEIMTPRLDMVAVEIHNTYRKVMDFTIQSGYSRIPVYDGNEDRVKGILYIKDFLPYIDKPDTFHWQSLIRPAYFVPETKRIDDLLEEFRTNKIHMAIVVDEYGGTSGIATMEDILEEIIGEIADEYDDDEQLYIRLADGSMIFEAKILLTDFYRDINAGPKEFGQLTEEVETLAGLILEIKGDFPRRGEVIEYGNFRFQILEIDERRILKVRVSRIIKEDKAIVPTDSKGAETDSKGTV